MIKEICKLKDKIKDLERKNKTLIRINISMQDRYYESLDTIKKLREELDELKRS